VAIGPHRMISAFRLRGGQDSVPAAAETTRPAFVEPDDPPRGDGADRRSRRPRLLRGLRAPWWLWIARIGLLVVAGVVVLSLVTVGEVWAAGMQDHRPRSDALIVLGASQYNGRPSEVFAARLDHAAELYRAGIAPMVITTGGRIPGDKYTEAGAGASYLERQGVPTSAILAVPEGRDTLESMVAVAGEMNTRGLRKAVVVTDRWHSLRSVSMARDLGLKAVSSPTTTGPTNRGFQTQARYIVREAVAYRFYQLFHRPTPPAASHPAV
jgi:uncharacterized SAM-binding protein YcdF (DUF218 family)